MPARKYAQKFCPNCGNPISGSATLCKDCSTTDFDFKDIVITLCTSCGSYSHKNKWQKFKDLNTVIKKIAQENIDAKVKISDIDDAEIEKILSYKAGVKKDHNIEVIYKGESFDIPIKVEITLCTNCSKRGNKYFEGILQLRNSNDEITAFVKNDIEKQKSRGIYLNKEVRIDKYSDKDVDYYLTDQTYLKTLAEKIRDAYGGKIKKNAQLFSIDWQSAKNLYRLNVLIEIPKYKKGDVIKNEGNLFKIVSLADRINVINLKTSKKTSLPHDDEHEVIHPVTMQVIKKFPEFELLDPNTYYQVKLMNPSEKLEINQKVKVVVDGSEAWLV